MEINNFAILTSLIIVILGTYVFIPFLQRLKFGQEIREEGPKRHMEKKGTPTMGGIVFIFAITITSFMAINIHSKYLYAVLGMILFGSVGFVDDYIKVVLKRNLGLRAYQKILMQIAVSAIIAYLTYDIGHEILIPFLNSTIDLGIYYYIFVVLFMISITNSVNLSDGLDGLATSVSISVMIFYVYFAYNLASTDLMNSSLIFIFALIGFLYFNKYPAKIFMGDTGSLAIGGYLGGLALVTGTELFIIIVCGVFVIETLSVILQVISFKTTGKRIFKMSPLHHHFELVGWSERKIVRVFFTVNLMLSMLGILISILGTII